MTAFTSAAFAQEPAALAFDKWRPKAGAYAALGRKFQSSCDESNDMTIDLGEKSVSGSEWGCEVKKLTDPAPGSLKVEITCSDNNLAQNLNPRDPNWETREFREIMFIRRLDGTTNFVQKSLNGKTRGEWLRAGWTNFSR